MGDIEFQIIFVIKNSNKSWKNRFCKEKLVKSGFTLGPTAWATIVSIKEDGLFFFFVTLRSPKKWCLLIVSKLLNIEQNFVENLFTSETKKNWGIWACPWYYWKVFNEYDLLKVIWKVLDRMCKRYSILNSFCHWKLN